MKNYYKILGIKTDATSEQIDAAYEKLLDWQEKYPDAYSQERRDEIDTAYDMLSNPETREPYDKDLQQHESQVRARQRQSDIRNKRYHPPPTRRPPPPRSRSSGNGRAGRSAIGIILFLVFIAFRALIGSDAFDSNNSSTPFRFATPNYSFIYNTPRPPTGGSTGSSLSGTICTGYTTMATSGYASDRMTVEHTIPAGTTLIYRRTLESEWHEIVSITGTYGKYVQASAVTTLTCLDSDIGGSNTDFTFSATSTPRRNSESTVNVCQVMGATDDSITVYSSPDQDSEATGELAARTRFLTVRESESWFSITGITTRQARGYVHLSEIDVLNCYGGTATSRPTARPTETPAIPFGG